VVGQFRVETDGTLVEISKVKMSSRYPVLVFTNSVPVFVDVTGGENPRISPHPRYHELSEPSVLINRQLCRYFKTINYTIGA
jgi:hypothetical protein